MVELLQVEWCWRELFQILQAGLVGGELECGAQGHCGSQNSYHKNSTCWLQFICERLPCGHSGRLETRKDFDKLCTHHSLQKQLR